MGNEISTFRNPADTFASDAQTTKSTSQEYSSSRLFWNAASNAESGKTGSQVEETLESSQPSSKSLPKFLGMDASRSNSIPMFSTSAGAGSKSVSTFSPAEEPSRDPIQSACVASRR